MRKNIIGLGLCLMVVLVFGEAYSQQKLEDVDVKLVCDSKTVSADDVVTFNVRVYNRSRKHLLLVNGDARPSYHPSTNELGFGLDFQTTNFHFFELPKLLKLPPSTETELRINIPVSSWKRIGTGSSTVISSIGILEETKLRRKLRQLGIAAGDEMSANDFLEIQRVFYSNKVAINILR